MTRYRDLLAIVLVNLAALGGIVWQLRDPRASAVRVQPPPLPTAAPTSTPVVVCVHVSGAVVRPGVVRLPEGARAGEAVDAAGGLDESADADAVNLAAPLADGQKLHVPVIGEAVGPASPVGAAAEGPGAAPDAGAAAPAPASGVGARLDINTADVRALDALPGIGPALAERIVAHRAEHGAFATVDDLVAVSGIGERTVERFRDLVEVR